MTIVLAITITHSTMAVAYGLVAMSIIEFGVNFAATRRYTTLSWWQTIKTLLPSLVLTTVMYMAVKTVGYYAASLAPAWLLLSQIGVGILSYALSAWAFRVEAFKEFVKTIKGVLKR